MYPAYYRHPMTPFQTTPLAVRNLPINLARTSLYPGQQQRVARAIGMWREHMDGSPQPTLLPQRMAFQQWKTNPDGARRYWLSSAQSYMDVVNHYAHGVPANLARQITPDVPTMPMAAAAYHRGADALYPSAENAAPIVIRSVQQGFGPPVVRGREYIERQVPPDAWVMTEGAARQRNAYNTFQKKRMAVEGARRALVMRRGVVG